MLPWMIEQIAANNELAKKDVKGVIETLAEIGAIRPVERIGRA